MTATVAEYRRNLSEASLQAAVVEFAEIHGWTVYQASNAAVAIAAKQGRYDAMPDVFVDAVFIREVVRWVEFKTAHGNLRPEQERLRDVLLMAGERWHLIRPSDWFDGSVDSIFVPYLTR